MLSMQNSERSFYHTRQRLIESLTGFVYLGNTITTSGIESPCRKECRILEDKCKGCGRTLAEISNWRLFTDSERKSIMERLSGDL
jgi:hypothetical protein